MLLAKFNFVNENIYVNIFILIKLKIILSLSHWPKCLGSYCRAAVTYLILLVVIGADFVGWWSACLTPCRVEHLPAGPCISVLGVGIFLEAHVVQVLVYDFFGYFSGCSEDLFKICSQRGSSTSSRSSKLKPIRRVLTAESCSAAREVICVILPLVSCRDWFRLCLVEGILTATSIYSTPFEPACDICSSPADPSALIDDGIIYCSNCSEFCPLIYKQCVNATIQTANNTKVQCTIKEPLLHTVLPDLSEMSYTTYLQAKPKTIYMLRKLKIHGKFAISKDGVLLHLYSPSTSAIWEEGGLYVVLILSTPRDMVVSDTWNQNILFKQANSMEVFDWILELIQSRKLWIDHPEQLQECVTALLFRPAHNSQDKLGGPYNI